MVITRRAFLAGSTLGIVAVGLAPRTALSAKPSPRPKPVKGPKPPVIEALVLPFTLPA
jgi:hypothetical protein